MPEGRSRVARSRRKQQRVEEDQIRFARPDWQVWEDCELCGKSRCWNNYSDRKVRRRRKRHFGVQVCAFCLSLGGHENARRLAMLRRLSAETMSEMVDLTVKLKEAGKL